MPSRPSIVRLVTLLALGLGLLASPVSAQPPELKPIPRTKPHPVLEVGVALPTVPTSRTGPGHNEKVIVASTLPRDKAPQLDYTDQTSNFTIGQSITGETSNATGVVLADEDAGSDGSLTLSEVQGTFEAGEPIADANGGSAIAAATQREGAWVLDFSYKPLRLQTIDIEQVGRRRVLYLYYKIVNRTGKPRMLVPQFYLMTDDGKRYPDRVLPQAVELIRARENPAIPLLGAVETNGLIPPSTKEKVDDAIYGVSIWVLDETIARADKLSVLVRGLSDGIQLLPPVDGKPQATAYKTLRLDFYRPGDHHDPKESEIRTADPPFEWIYDESASPGA